MSNTNIDISISSWTYSENALIALVDRGYSLKQTATRLIYTTMKHVTMYVQAHTCVVMFDVSSSEIRW